MEGHRTHRSFVLGWYGHNNLGDEAFKTAITQLWPKVDFTFGDRLPIDINLYDSLWIGGGSFLGEEIPGINDAQITIPILFIGIGVDPAIKQSNQTLVSKAKLVIVRDLKSKTLISSSILSPDLVFAMSPDPCFINLRKTKQVTILLNDFLTPTNRSPEWKSMSYYWFLNQFGDVCNDLIAKGYKLHFIPMCTGSVDDRRIAAAVIGRISDKDSIVWYLRDVSERELRTQIALSQFVITQRFHGIVFSAMCGTSFVSIRAHDKLHNLAKELNWSADLDYYGFTKLQFNQVTSSNFLDQGVRLLDFSKDCAARWLCISDIVTRELSL